jgi:opacity protein-like surface antigen
MKTNERPANTPRLSGRLGHLLKNRILLLLLVAAGLQTGLAAGLWEHDDTRWLFRFDMGGTIPLDAKLNEFEPPVSDGHLRLSPGFQMDLALDYKLTPWLAVGGELGFLFNGVDEVGGFKYHNTDLFQMPIMANLTLRYPNQSRFVPYIGVGGGGLASALDFGGGGYGYYSYWEPDGTASTFTLAAQGFAGVNYRLSDKMDLGVIYRFLYTDSQSWDVEWWNGYRFGVGVDSIMVHSFCLVFTGHF